MTLFNRHPDFEDRWYITDGLLFWNEINSQTQAGNFGDVYGYGSIRPDHPDGLSQMKARVTGNRALLVDEISTAVVGKLQATPGAYARDLPALLLAVILGGALGTLLLWLLLILAALDVGLVGGGALVTLFAALGAIVGGVRRLSGRHRADAPTAPESAPEGDL